MHVLQSRALEDNAVSFIQRKKSETESREFVLGKVISVHTHTHTHTHVPCITAAEAMRYTFAEIATNDRVIVACMNFAGTSRSSGQD